jgi:hypothetical protein
MLQAKESTEVAKQNQNCRPSKQSVRGEDLAVDPDQVEVKIDPHPTMMRSSEHRYVIRITAGQRLAHHALRRANENHDPVFRRLPS